jgi:hypothetical protein
MWKLILYLEVMSEAMEGLVIPLEERRLETKIVIIFIVCTFYKPL